MSVSEKINSVMLQALLKDAQKIQRPVTDMYIFLSLSTNGELVCKMFYRSLMQSQPSLSELIGTFYAMASKGRIKKMIADQEGQLNARRGDVFVRVETKDGKSIELTVLKNSQEIKKIQIDQLL